MLRLLARHTLAEARTTVARCARFATAASSTSSSSSSTAATGSPFSAFAPQASVAVAAAAATAAAALPAPSADAIASVAAWKAGKALVDLRAILDTERAAAQRATYDERMMQYALYDEAPASVVQFWFANKPATVERSTLHYNVLMHAKATHADRAAAADAVVAAHARMRAENIAADESTYEVLISALARAARTKEAVAAFEAMVAGGLLPRVSHYLALILMHARNKDGAAAEAWAARLKADKDIAPSREALYAMVEAFSASPADAKKHETKIKALRAQIDTLNAAETVAQAADEPSGVQWKMHFKPVTSTGGEDKGAAAKGGAAAKAPAAAAKPAAKK